MRVNVSKENLVASVARMQGTISERSLAHIGLRAADGLMELVAADRVLAVYNKVPCEVRQPGQAFVPAKLFSEVVRELPDGSVSLDVENVHVVIRTVGDRSFEMKLPLIDSATWQDLPVIDSDNMSEISASRLAYMISQVQFCVVTESPRNYGTVAYLHKPTPDTCRLVGTDGFRLSYAEAKFAMPDSFLPSGISLSKRALMELESMCKEGFETVSIKISTDLTMLLAEVPGYQLFVRLSNVKYPNYIGVLPQKPMKAVLVSREGLQHVTRRVMLAADKSRALQLSFSDSSLTLSSKTVGTSEGHETVDLMDYHGPRVDISVNGRFLSDVFSTSESEYLALHFNQENSEDPVMIVPRQEPAECRSRHVLVPIRQQG